MKQELSSFVAIILSCVLLAPAWGAETVKVGAGAGAPTENILKPVKDGFEKATGLQLVIIPSGVKASLQDLEAGAIDAAAAGLAFQDWLAFMKKEGAEVKDPAAFTPAVVGKDRIAIFVNKANPVASLSREQLQKIFTGEIESWQDAGGSDQPIIIVWGQLQQGTNSTFTKQIMDGKPVTKDILAVPTANDVRTSVAANPSAIGFGPGGLVNDTIKPVSAPEISRDITLATKGKPSAKVQKLIDYITGEGKKLIRQ